MYRATGRPNWVNPTVFEAKAGRRGALSVYEGPVDPLFLILFRWRLQLRSVCKQLDHTLQHHSKQTKNEDSQADPAPIRLSLDIRSLLWAYGNHFSAGGRRS